MPAQNYCWKKKKYPENAKYKLDDFVNYIPSRISAYLMVAASFFCGKRFSGKQAFYIYKRDNRKHASPNSAQTESVCAGALGIQLAGDASYFGKVVVYVERTGGRSHLSLYQKGNAL